MNFNLDKASYKSHTQIQEYSYSSKNIDSLTKELNLDLVEIYKTLDFYSFFLLFKNCIDQCCKLASLSKNKALAYEKSNTILEFVNLYM